MSSVNPFEKPQADLTAGAPQVEVFDDSSPFSPSGRFARSTYIVYSMGLTVGALIIMAALGGLMTMVDSTAISGIGAVLFFALYIALIVLSFIFMIKRLHDINWSGWLSVLTLIPLANFVVAIAMLAVPGTAGENTYGPPPRPNKRHVYLAVFLLVFVVGGGILAAIAIPAYQEYVMAAQQAAAMGQ